MYIITYYDIFVIVIVKGGRFLQFVKFYRMDLQA